MFRLFYAALFAATFSTAAFAACTSPAGQESQTRYDYAAHKMYYCNNSVWAEMGASAADTLAGLSCAEGETIVMDASGWECGSAGGSSDCTTGPIGTVCTSDGAYYIGDIGGVRIYARSTDSPNAVQWKSDRTDTAGTNSYTDGIANSNNMRGAGGHPVATLCRSYGSQWYVPAKDELNLIWQNSQANGRLLNLVVMNIQSGAYYWSSSQSLNYASTAWQQRFNDGTQYDSNYKDTYHRLRCVRR